MAEVMAQFDAPAPQHADTVWPPDDGGRLTPVRLGIAAVAAVVGAACLPLPRVGIGWALSGLAVVAGVFVLAGPSGGVGAGDPRRSRLRLVSLAVVAVGLLATPAVFASGWVLVCAVLGALLVAGVATGRGRSWRELLLCVVVPVWAIRRAVPWAARSTSSGRTPSGSAVARLLLSTLVAALLVVTFVILFSSADPVFANVVRERVRGITLGVAVGSVVLLLLILGLAYALRFPLQLESAAGVLERRLGRLDWLVPLTVVDLVFLAFVAVQLRVLFGGERYVLSKGGPDYADYARGGFVQLLAVTVLTIGVIAVVGVFARRDSAADLRLIRILVGPLGAMTLVVIASAFNRTALYVGAYGFTRPRLLAEVLEIWLGIVVVLVLVAGVRLSATWLPRASLAAALAVLCGLMAMDPDALMARTLLSRTEHGYAVDNRYLESLSADAVPVLDTLSEPYRSCLLALIAEDLAKPDPWYAYNLSRARARAILAARPIHPGACQPD
jgi:hypothetical protein